jgi:predicted ABC-type ATPase
VFLWLPSADFAIERVAERVRAGGHNVQAETVRRRYRAGLRNFVEEGYLIDEALKQGVREAMIRHKKDGLPVVIYRDGRAVWVMPEELGF